MRSANGAAGSAERIRQLQTTTRRSPSTTRDSFPSITFSFNLAPGVALGDAVDAISQPERDMGMPDNIQRQFSGTAQAFQASLANQPMLILAALVAVYIVLGILYESYIHPITILSTLPSAGVGRDVGAACCATN